MPSLLALASTLLSTLGVLALASPLLTNDISALEARDEWQITPSSLLCMYMTNEPNWGGEAINLCEVGGSCGNKLPDGLTANVSSAGPEPGVTCFLFSEQNCEGDRSFPLVNPGYADLSTIGFDKKAQSWKCWKWCGWMDTSSASSSLSASTVDAALMPRLVSITTTIDGFTQTAITAPGLPSISSMSSESATGSSSEQAAIFETSMTTIVVTHTYADGSTTVISSPLAIPIAVSSSETDTVGDTVSLTTTIGQSLVGPTPAGPSPFSTPEVSETPPTPFPTIEASEAGVSITTTLDATDSTSSAAGVSITTTLGASSPLSTLMSEGVTVPVPSVSAPDPTSSLADPKIPDPEIETSVVTLTGFDATLTVTTTDGPARAR